MATLVQEIETLIHEGEERLRKAATPPEDRVHPQDENPTKRLLNQAIGNAPSPAMYVDPKLYDGVVIEFQATGSAPSYSATVEDSGDRVTFTTVQDARGKTGTLTGNAVVLLTGLRPWVRIRPTISAGTITAVVTPIRGAAALGAALQAYDTSDGIYVGGALVSPQFAFANIASATTDGAIVNAVAGKKIRVLALILQAGGTATTVTFNSKPAGAGTAISMTFQNGSNGGAVLPYNAKGWFQTNAGEGLTGTTGTGSTVGVQVVYLLV